ncbi:hypothetical protein MLD38_004760 [Melastoma candidum]|uniref:Uncharacterized protein n=1 Tax=Melastoma candidum TaxID=119954 RepID=A0ACB9S888_9MYRT|nr:hypothetical protein MLD38_004760 [Melastoma candidum]
MCFQPRVLSMDGDSQGLERLFGALSAHMRPDSDVGGSSSNISGGENNQEQKQGCNAAVPLASTAETSAMEDDDGAEHNEPEGADACEAKEDKQLDFEDLEQLMIEIGNMRSNLFLMPDFQRREMAAKLAMKMASMFGGTSDEDD